MIGAWAESWSETLTHVYIALWGAGTVLILISLERKFSRRRLFFWLGISCLTLGAAIGLITDWDNTFRAVMSVAALLLCGTCVAIRVLRGKLRSRRHVRLLKDAIEHMGAERTDED